MQKTMLAAALAATMGMTVSAQAADLNRGSYKDAPVYLPANTWTGFYFGAGGGGGMVNHDLNGGLSWGKGDEDGVSAGLDGIGGEGGFGTVQLGYDRQLDQHFVVGVFFDYDFTSIESKAGISFDGDTFEIKATLTDSWTVGGRVGYLVNANTLVYGLAGYTQAHFDLPFGVNGDFNGGWTAGAGIETNLGGNWFLKGEYRFTSLDEKTLLAGSFEGRREKEVSYELTDQPDIQTGRLVLSYKLNGTAYDALK